MFLKSLTLRGFKSFANKTTLDFEPGITCIVGPNGSGKSNISDAILWVLGERSAKNIRGEAMNDVIFSGAKNKKRASMAEVSLVLDNGDGTLDIDYSEVVITRRMYVTGESDYFLNDSQVRRMDIVNILHDSGLGSGTNSIISQGSLDSVLSLDPHELKTLIEESAGILKQKQRKEKSLAKLEKIQANFEKISAVNDEVERQLEPLRRRAKRAQTYLDIKDDLREATLQIAVDDYRNVTAKQKDLANESSEKQKAIDEADAQIQDANEKLNAVTEKIKEINNRNTLFSANLERSTALSSKFESVLMMLANEISRATRNAEDAEVAAAQAKFELEDKRKSQEVLITEIENARADLKKAEDAQQKLLEQDEGLAKEITDLTSQIRDAENKHSKAHNDLLSNERLKNEISGSIEGAKARSLVFEQEKANAQTKIDEQAQFVEQLKAKLLTLEDDLSAAKAKDKECKQALDKANSSLDAANEALRKAQSSVDNSQAKIDALSEIVEAEEAGSESMEIASKIATLKDSTSILQNIKVDAGYEDLVEALLGGDFESLLVSSGKEVEEASTFAKTFAGNPALQLHVKKDFEIAPLNISNELLLDHVKCKGEAQRAVKNLIGDVYVCDSLKEALDLAKKHSQHSFVTMDGDFIGARGSVKLNAFTKKSTKGILARKRELDDLKAEFSKLEKELSKQKETLEACVKVAGKAQESSIKAAQNFAQASANFEAQKVLVEKNVNELESLKESKETLAKEHEKLVSGLVTTAEELASITKKIEEAESLCAEIQESSRKLNDNKSKLEESRAELSQGLNSAKAKVDACKSAFAEKESLQNAITERINSLEKAIVTSLDRSTKLSEAIEDLRPIEARLKTLQNHALRVQQEFATSSLTESSDDLFEQSKSLRDEASEAHFKKDKLVSALSEIRVEETKCQIEIERLKQVITEKCETPIHEIEGLPKLQNRAEVAAKQESLSKKMARLGNIDLDSIDALCYMEARYDYLNSNLDDIKASISAIKKIDELINERFRVQFEQTFDKVSGNFAWTFSKLFPGGAGELELDEPENIDETGVVIKANPAGKKIRKISLLSGGEKSLVALSFLFAIYAARNTPFYILDEVEAALDDTNLARMLDFVNNMRNDVQFIFITHQRRTMEMADVLFGVSMQADGVTKVISQRLDALES